MTADPHATDEEGGFRVTDRRGRGQEEAAPATTPRPVAAAPAPAPPDAPALSGDLRPLIVMLANVAMLALEGAPDPATGEGQVDLDEAEDAIESLLTLRDRTAGRLTGEETTLLERALYEVRLRYTEVAAPPPHR